MNTCIYIMLDSDGFWCIQRQSLSCYTKPSKTMCKMQWCLQDCDGWSAFNERLHSVPRLRPDLPDHCIAHTTLCQILNLIPFQILPCPYFIPSNALLCPNLISLHSAMSILHTLREHPAKKNPLFWHCPSNLSNYSTLNGPRRLCLFTRSQGRDVIKLARTESIILSIPCLLSPRGPMSQRKKCLLSWKQR